MGQRRRGFTGAARATAWRWIGRHDLCILIDSSLHASQGSFNVRDEHNPPTFRPITFTERERIGTSCDLNTRGAFSLARRRCSTEQSGGKKGFPRGQRDRDDSLEHDSISEFGVSELPVAQLVRNGVSSTCPTMT